MVKAVRKLWLPCAAFLFVATAICLLAAIQPPRLNDSFWIDWVWLDQFSRELLSGNPYPRWLPLSHHGLGSPVFYYYPPLAFYVGSFFVLCGLSVYGAIIATFWAAFLLSGSAMYLWLNGRARAPVIGAILFMIAPYHVFNFYQRGALAESLATALLPLVMVGIRFTTEGHWRGLAITAGAYGLLLMTHLPLALLATIFLLVPYACTTARGRIVKVCASFAIGGALSAIYLIPALALEPYRSSADLWSLPMLQPSNWSVWNAGAWSDTAFRAVVLVAAGIGIPLVALCMRKRSAWGFWALICAAIAVGFVPFLWSLPALNAVQFPFRLLPIAEFAFATAFASAPRDRTASPILWGPLLAMAAFGILAKPINVDFSFEQLRQLHPDVPENLPPAKRPYSWPSRWALTVAGSHTAPQTRGGLTLEPVFYFPSWKVTCAGRSVASSPDPTTQLLRHHGDGCDRTLIQTAPQKVGKAASILGLLTLIAMCLVGRLRSFTGLRPTLRIREDKPVSFSS